jgi:adhesin transport system outer membrane protein
MPERRRTAFATRLLSAFVLCAGAGAHAGDLRDALQATLGNHPALAGQAAEVEARRYAADGARSQRYPTLSAEARQFSDSSQSVVEGDRLSHPALLRVRQPIWAFGRIKSGIAVADADTDTERADLERVRRRLLEDTAVAYAVVRGSLERVDVARQNVSEHVELLAQIERRVEGQLAPKADVLLAATRLGQARAALEHAASEWDVARADLIGLTQVDTGADAPVPAELLQLGDPTALVEKAMSESAEIHLKEQQLGRADAEVDHARTIYRPTLYVQADKFYDQPGLRDDSQLSAVFEASLDGLGFAARGRTGEAVAARTAAAHDLAATRVDLRRQIERIARSRELQHQLIELETQSLRDLEALLASYRRQHESGTKSWLDLMNIQRELFEQRRLLVRARNEWQIHSLQLLAMSGGLDALGGLPEQSDD